RASVLITGETGTGKELVAHAIHHNSSLAENPFVVVDCAALPGSLVESILFGHERGAFTGADKARVGLIKQADGGTLFLDEVAELPIDVQSRFLRVLQEKRFRPVGSKQEVKSDFRLLAATNRNLKRMVREGTFREDLLFRLQAMVVDLPPLRERTEDIRDLAFYYTARICDRYGIGIKGFSPEFFETLTTYNWPGNVRELINALEQSIAVAHDEPTLFPIHLPDHIRIQMAYALLDKKVPKKHYAKKISKNKEFIPKLRKLLEITEQQYLEDLMSITKGNVRDACRISGLSRSRFYDRLKKYNIARHI
ncbi:MAG: sigma-54-dependent Fis family transcriptional regulator, partial [Deltaproteobacteria bacterium]|nr:sigma-54-dependent Fis family transcriptional regulator [Deltaproteobacteria bacterium]MBW2152261.1 sigma-54-dependent Fis family transcriptional regulator [Deltaproteobacteria bacterium]